MNQIFKKCLTVVALACVASAAQALPKIDPALKTVMAQASGQGSLIKVIVMFKDKAPVGRAAHVAMTHGQVEMAMRQNARASQMGLAKQMFSVKAAGSSVKMESLWLFNAAIIELPANQIKALTQNEDLTYIYANHAAHIFTPVAESGAANLTADTYTYGLRKINIPQLREKAPKLLGAGVRVGILDTGIDSTHPDLKGRVSTFKDFIAGKNEPYDDNSHGTHVAGTISGGNASGTYIGVAPEVKLIIGKVFTAGGSGSWDSILKAMQWIADPDGNPNTNDQPMLVSNSWGGGGPNGTKDPQEEPLCQAVAGWVKLGILPVFAAGNSGPGASSVGLPGACPQALTAGATDQNDVIASFSSRGPARWKSGQVIKPTVAAPGVKIMSSVPGGGYKEYSGTSMATPHTAGLAALVYQANPKANVEQVQKIIAAGAKHLSETNEPNNTFGYGRIDAFSTIKTLVNAMRQGN